MKSILLVDDTVDIRALYGGILRREGYEVQEAENGQDALELLERTPGNPCLILLDLMMPIMNGSELLQTLQAGHRFASLPVIVLSAGGRAADAPGAARFVRKPVDPQVLLALVHEFCGVPD